MASYSSVTWPSADDSIFGEGDHWSDTACLAWSRGTWYARIRGFREGALALANQVATTGRNQDGLIFPFLFLWRQHFELALKALTIDAERLLDRPPSSLTSHSLDPLWRRCRALLEEIEPKADEFEHVDRILGELHALDPGGQAFRYPVTTNGDLTLRTTDRLSFSRVNDGLDGASSFLGAASSMVAARLEDKEEFDRAICDYWPDESLPQP